MKKLAKLGILVAVAIFVFAPTASRAVEVLFAITHREFLIRAQET